MGKRAPGFVEFARFLGNGLIGSYPQVACLATLRDSGNGRYHRSQQFKEIRQGVIMALIKCDEHGADVSDKAPAYLPYIN